MGATRAGPPPAGPAAGPPPRRGEPTRRARGPPASAPGRGAGAAGRAAARGGRPAVGGRRSRRRRSGARLGRRSRDVRHVRRGADAGGGTRKATLGSTSYDEARDPADATWSGASWYGPDVGRVLDHQPARVRRPAQARARIPVARPQDGRGSVGLGHDRGRAADRGDAGRGRRTTEPAVARGQAFETRAAAADPARRRTRADARGPRRACGPTGPPGVERRRSRARRGMRPESALLEPVPAPAGSARHLGDIGPLARAGGRRSRRRPATGSAAPTDDPVRRVGLALVVVAADRDRRRGRDRRGHRLQRLLGRVRRHRFAAPVARPGGDPRAAAPAAAARPAACRRDRGGRCLRSCR